MGNTPCAHAVDSVLHRRVEIKTHKRRSLITKSAEDGLSVSWWPTRT